MERLIRMGLTSGLPAIIAILALALGAMALVFTPREEEPQIEVPLVRLSVEAPGLSATQVERQVAIPVEKLLAQIPGVEHIYSTTRTGGTTVTLRFYVGEDREEALLNTYIKLFSNQDRIPPGVADWIVREMSVDDVPIVVLGLWSENADLYSDYELRRMAAEMATELQAIPQTKGVTVTGGRPRVIRLLLDSESLTAHKTTPLDVIEAIRLSNRLSRTGALLGHNRIEIVESGDFIASLDELRQMPVNVIDGVSVRLGDIATIEDGPDLPEQYNWLEFGAAHPEGLDDAKSPVVTLAIAKQPGANAVWVAGDVHRKIAQLQSELLPPQVHVEVLRDYGETADDKVNNLATSLGIAILTVVVFIGIFLGPRPAIVVGLAVPICYGVTLALDMAFGYTINRVTLFALILSLGLLVDDPITGVDNIERFLRETSGDRLDRILGAMMEIRGALVMSTLTIVLAFVPLAFITGMMGPYMAPMAFNVPVSVVASTIVAFLVTPWIANKLIRPRRDVTVNGDGIYSRLIRPVISSPARARLLLWFVLLLFLIAVALPALRLVPLKLLPFDNKNELQIVLDMPEGTSLEATAAKAAQIGDVLKKMPEVRALAYFIGRPSPIDFNGLIRQYDLREAPHLADIRITLADKHRRTLQSHGIVLKMRKLLKPLAQRGVMIRVVEVPPGPPVISTLVAEIYGTASTPYADLHRAANTLAERMIREPHVLDVETTAEAVTARQRFVTDKQKAALSGIATADIEATVRAASAGTVASHMNFERELDPVPLLVRLPDTERMTIEELDGLYVRGRPGIARTDARLGLEAAPQPLVALGELGEFRQVASDQPIYRKNLLPVVYVMAEISGRTPADVIADIVADRGDAPVAKSEWSARTFLTPGGTAAWNVADDIAVRWAGEGEWQVTLRVFRDMGLAFAFALVAIFIVLRIQTSSSVIALIIMSAIPLTFIGIMPGFWLLNLLVGANVAGAPNPVLFTATAMIGMIALAGIVVRNSLILVEFINNRREEGASVSDAIASAGEVRMRPILLTAGTTLLGNMIITLDPVFSGLALAIIFGIIASTFFTLAVVPAAYYLIFRDPEDSP
ncbi:MAG: efflux RND transporter permease subunit [Halioglobus sp.]|nr:efflux RND transporter permease subunit [Halioglobus sp.]